MLFTEKLPIFEAIKKSHRPSRGFLMINITVMELSVRIAPFFVHTELVKFKKITSITSELCYLSVVKMHDFFYFSDFSCQKICIIKIYLYLCSNRTRLHPIRTASGSFFYI